MHAPLRRAHCYAESRSSNQGAEAQLLPAAADGEGHKAKVKWSEKHVESGERLYDWPASKMRGVPHDVSPWRPAAQADAADIQWVTRCQTMVYVKSISQAGRLASTL